MKLLSDMSNEELWELFPIILTEYRPEWAKNFKLEQKLLEDTLGTEHIIAIKHIGSTSVPGLIAKPTVDILLEITDDTDIHWLKEKMAGAGYGYNDVPAKPAPHLTFIKGYMPRGFEGQVYHVHIRYNGDWDEPYFCEYLRRHPEAAAAYGKLKLQLKQDFEHDRDGYTEAKTEFIKRITEKAREESVL